MYNQEVKERFIKEYTTSISRREACVSAFNVFERHEVAWGADLCTKETRDLQPIVDEAIGIRNKSKPFRVIILKEYTKWCMKNSIPGACDGMLHVDTSNVGKMKRQTVTSPLHLQLYLDQICEPEQEKTTDNIYRCFYWLAYGGASEDEILRIKTYDVDLSAMVVHGAGDYPIYREAILAFKNCVELSQFQYKHPNYSMGKVVYRQRAEGDTLIRGIRSAPSTQAMRVELSRRSKRCLEEHKTELKLSYYRVWISGLFYRMYERERAGLPVDFVDAAIHSTEGRLYKLDTGRNTQMAYRRKVAREYLQDYENWKLTFI